MSDIPEQLAALGVDVQARGTMVELQARGGRVLMTPREAQRFAYWLARAYVRAGGPEAQTGTPRLSSMAR